MSKRRQKPWNRCIECGRFFSIEECNRGEITLDEVAESIKALRPKRWSEKHPIIATAFIILVSLMILVIIATW